MTSTINKTTFIFCLLFSVILFNRCDEEEEKDMVNSENIEGVFYYHENESTGNIRVLDAYGGIRRGYTLSSDNTLQDIVEDRETLYLKAYRAPVLSVASPDGRFVKPKMEFEDGWLLCSNVITDLVTNDTESWFEVWDDDDLFYGFIFHKVGEESGEKVYAIESMLFPGKYISHQGHPIQGTNTISLTAHSNPESAPKFRLFRPSGNFIEGNINIGQ